LSLFMLAISVSNRASDFKTLNAGGSMTCQPTREEGDQMPSAGTDMCASDRRSGNLARDRMQENKAERKRDEGLEVEGPKQDRRVMLYVQCAGKGRSPQLLHPQSFKFQQHTHCTWPAFGASQPFCPSSPNAGRCLFPCYHPTAGDHAASRRAKKGIPPTCLRGIIE
jgi:hypothetical protein